MVQGSMFESQASRPIPQACVCTGSRHTVNLHLAVLNNRLDQALLLEVPEALPGERAVDLHSVDEGSDGDETVRLDILVELLGGGLVEDDGVLGLVLDLALGPRFPPSVNILVLRRKTK